MRKTIQIALVVPLLAASALAADMSYVGKWKLNVTKSNFTEMTMSFKERGGDGYKVTADGLFYEFKLDSKEYQTPWGTTAAWKSIDANTWEITNRSKGKVVSTETMTLSADGKVLTIQSKLMKASGESSDNTMIYRRIGGTAGLAGKWKTSHMNVSSPGIIELIAMEPDGLTLKFNDAGGVCAAKLDGRNYPATGSMWPAGWSCSVTDRGERGLDVKWSKDGKAMYKSTFTVSPDGMTLSEVGGAAKKREVTTSVYDRQ